MDQFVQLGQEVGFLVPDVWLGRHASSETFTLQISPAIGAALLLLRAAGAVRVPFFSEPSSGTPISCRVGPAGE